MNKNIVNILILVFVIIIVVLAMTSEPYKIDHEIGARIKRESDSSKNSTDDDTGGFSFNKNDRFCPENYTINSKGKCVPIYYPYAK
jgi:hypothetical protein